MGVRTCLVAVAVVLVVASSCSRGGDDAAPQTPVTDPAGSDVMRSVPTVPPSSTADFQPSPTIVPPPPGPIDPDAPVVTVAPPPTDVIGDPQPKPNVTAAPPPPTPPADAPPPPDACTQFAAFEVEQVVAESTGRPAVSELVADDVCRITAGDVVAELAFISLDAFLGDWARREGIQPVGEVSGDAVGLGSFQTPSGGSGAGYTIAVAGNARAVVVSVRASSESRGLAAEVAVLAQQTA